MKSAEYPHVTASDSSSGQFDDPPVEAGVPSLMYQEFHLAEEESQSAQPADGPPDPDLPPGRTFGLSLHVSQWGGTEDQSGDWGDAPRRLPRVGDEVMGFRLLRELGRGAFAR